MAQTPTEHLIIGSLMHNPRVLLQKDKYQLSIKDFDTTLYRYAFYAIANMVQDGVLGEIPVPEIENWLGEASRGKDIYQATSGRNALVDALTAAKATGFNFGSLYEQLKKENVLRDLKRANFATEEFFVDNAVTDDEKALNDKYATLKASDILNTLDRRLLGVKQSYLRGDSSESQTLNTGLKDLILGLADAPEIGLPLQGDYFNFISAGALKGKFYLRSGGSGTGKTRSAMADACYLAFPLRYSWDAREWVKTGSCEKVLIIITEQSVDEVQKMAFAYLTGINESVFKRGNLHTSQKKVAEEAFKIFEEYEDNFHIIRVPSPSISVVKELIREKITLDQIEYVFYDYIFESPSLFAEFQGMNLRTDQMLFMFSDALKSLAVELDIFIMSSTQLNAKGDGSKDIRNESAIAGSRAVINKADMGCIMARPQTEELNSLSSVIEKVGVEPNVVTDIYKNRGGEYTQIRIWSYIDLGTMRKEDLFVTDSRLEIPKSFAIDFELYRNGLSEEKEEKLNTVLGRLKGCDNA